MRSDYGVHAVNTIKLVNASTPNACIRQGGAFTANGARMVLKNARLSSINSSSDVAAALTPRIISMGLLHNGCPVQPPSATAFVSDSRNSEASVHYDSTFVQADGYFFFVDLRDDKFPSGKNRPKIINALPPLQWTFDISTALDNWSINSMAGAASNNLSNGSIVRKWTSIGASVWTRRYRFIHAVPVTTADSMFFL
jgi:hypothetical protein